MGKRRVWSRRSACERAAPSVLRAREGNPPPPRFAQWRTQRGLTKSSAAACGGGGLRRSRKTEGICFHLPLDAGGALLGAVFECAETIEHALAARSQFGEGTRLFWFVEGRAAGDDRREAQQLAAAGIDHQVDAVFAKGDGGFKLAAAFGGVGVTVELLFQQDVEIAKEENAVALQPQQRPQGRVDHRCQQGVRHGESMTLVPRLVESGGSYPTLRWARALNVGAKVFRYPTNLTPLFPTICHTNGCHPGSA